MPVRSGLPSAVRGAGAARFTLPSALRGRPGVLVVSHCAPADVADNTNPTARQIAFIRPQLSRTPERPSIPPLFYAPGRPLTGGSSSGPSRTALYTNPASAAPMIG